MKKNMFIEILSSLPVILLALFFSRFLGICLILLRFISHGSKKRDLTPIVLVITGIVVYIPKMLEALFKTIKFNTKNIPYFNDILTADLYTKNFLSFGKALIIIGIIFAILSYLLNKVAKGVNEYLKAGMDSFTTKQVEMERENDLKIKEKQERAKNTQVVTCKKCGASNIVTEKISKCKYCRNTIVGK